MSDGEEPFAPRAMSCLGSSVRLLECGPGANSCSPQDLCDLWRTITSQQASPPSNTLHQQQTPNPRPDSAALGRGDSWTWKPLRAPPPRTRPEDTCSDVRNRQALHGRSAGAIPAPGQPPSPARLDPSLATTPVRPSAFPAAAPGGEARPGRLGPPASYRSGIRLPRCAVSAAARRPGGAGGRRGRWRRRGSGGGGGGRGGGGAEAGRGTGVGRHTGGRPLSHFPRDREIASRQPIKCLHVVGRGAAAARKRGTQLPFLRRTPSRRSLYGLARVKRYWLALGKMVAGGVASRVILRRDGDI